MPTFSSMAFFSFSLTSACVLPSTFLMMAFASFRIVTDCVAALPASVLSLADVPLAVCSSFWHDISPFRNEQYRNQGNKATRKSNCYQKVIICPRSHAALSIGGAIFALPEAFFFGYSGAIFERSKALFIDYSGAKHACPAPLITRKVITLSFLPKRPQGTTKILGTPAFAGTKTPAVLKFSSKGATTDCVETPVNCPHCGQKWRLRAALPTPALYPAISFSSPKKLEKRSRKRSHTNVCQNIGHTVKPFSFQSPAQTPHVRFRR